MATFMLRSFLRPQFVGVGLGLCYGVTQLQKQRPVRLDGTMLSGDSYSSSAKTPVIRQGRLNPKAVRQISSGSIIGLVAGLAVSAFSRSLALLIGLLVVGVQWAASYGINVLPYNKLQRYVTSIDLRSAIQDDVAFKISFGSTFALAAFMHL